MAKRVILDSTAASPLRVSVAGVDADLAEFNDLIFDGNQPPMRLYLNGVQSCNGMTFNEFTGGQNIREGSLVPVLSTPSGTTPIFMVNFIMSTHAGGGFVRSPTYNGAANNNETNGGGAGGAIVQPSDNYFVPVCFTVGPPGLPDDLPPVTYVNYAVFKNYT